MNFDRTNTANVNNLAADLTSMVFSDQAPDDGGVGVRRQHGLHRGDERRASTGRRCCSSACSGSRRGSPFVANPTCFEHASKPYFTTADMSDWTWVTIDHKATPTDRTAAIQPYNIPRCETATTLTLSLPRVGFYTTPAFLALWNTNDSNQHRVTANQTLMVALGRVVHERERDHPASAPPGSTRPTRWPAASASAATRASTRCGSSGRPSSTSTTATTSRPRTGSRAAAANPRPTTIGGVLAFGNVNATGADITALGPLLLQVKDIGRRGQPGEPVRDLADAAALLLRELGDVPGERPGVPAGGAGVPEQQLQLPDADPGAVLVAAGDERQHDGDDRAERREHQHRAAGPDLRGAVEPAGDGGRLRAGGAAAELDPEHHLEDRQQRGAGRVQPGERDPGDAVGSEPVLPGGERDAVREHGAQGGGPDERDERLPERERGDGDRGNGARRWWAIRRATRTTRWR